MEVVLVEPGMEARIAEIGSDLKSLQAAVGGYIEAAYFFDDPVALICNEEGKCMGLKPNRALYRGGKPYDVIVGTFLVVGVDEEDFTDLREEDAAYFEKLFHSPEKFKYFAGRLVISKVVSGGA